jgi:hypothetical protein
MQFLMINFLLFSIIPIGDAKTLKEKTYKKVIDQKEIVDKSGKKKGKIVHVGMRYVGWLLVCAGLRILRWLRIVGVAMTLEGRRRAELLGLAVILFRRVSL